MSLASYAVRPVADWTAGILVCAFIGVNFAQGYLNAPSDQLGNIAREKLSSLAASVLPSWMTGGAESYTSATQSGFLNTAEQWIGKDEDQDKAELSAFISKAGISINPASTAWCAAFVNAVLYANGIKGTGEVNAKSFLQWGIATAKPQPGDIAVLWRGSPDSWQGHVGFFKGFDRNGNVLVLGGNQDDKVSIEAFSAGRVLGFRTNQRPGV